MSDLIVLIAVLMNKPEALAAAAIVMLLCVFITMYVVQAIKAVKAIPTPDIWWVNILLTITAVSVNAGLAEYGIYNALGLHAGAWLGGAVIAIAYNLYGNADPEKQLLNTIVKNTVGRFTALVDNGAPHPVAQKDYTNNGQ